MFLLFVSLLIIQTVVKVMCAIYITCRDEDILCQCTLTFVLDKCSIVFLNSNMYVQMQFYTFLHYITAEYYPECFKGLLKDGDGGWEGEKMGVETA